MTTGQYVSRDQELCTSGESPPGSAPLVESLPRILILAESSVRDWASAKIGSTGEQLRGDRPRTIVRNLEHGPCVMTLNIINYNFCSIYHVAEYLTIQKCVAFV